MAGDTGEIQPLRVLVTTSGDEPSTEERAWLLQAWELHLPLLDIVLNPGLSWYAAMSAVSSVVAGRVRREERRVNSGTVNRFFDEEHLARMEAKQARERVKLKRSRYVGILVTLTLLFVLAVGAVMLSIYCYLKPIFPHLDVVTAHFDYLVMDDLNASQLVAQQDEGKGQYYAALYNFSFTYTIDFQNPNKKVDLFVHSLELTDFYYGFRMGSATAAPFTQPRRTSRTLHLTVVEHALHVPLKEHYSIKRDISKTTIAFVVEMNLKAKMSTVLGLRSPSFWCSVKCDILLDDWGLITEKVCFNRNRGI